MNAPQPIPFTPDWPEPLSRLLRPERPKPPALPLHDVLDKRLAQWVEQAAEGKGAPADYVFAALLSVSGALIGNARWVSVSPSWKEPPVIWSALIGLPSSGKSPALDAAIHPARKMEKRLREAADAEVQEWSEKADVAKLLESTWKESVKAAIKAGDEVPERPKGCDAGLAPHVPRLVVTDATIERLGEILSRQPRGTLQMRDELAGWLQNMERYSGGGSDKPFWLEAYGGRLYSVERMGRPPLSVDRLTIGVVGGIQPDRLKTLLFKTDDDGLLARFLPIWPDPAPIRRPRAFADEELIERALDRLLSLDLVADEHGETRPWFVHFTDEAQDLMLDFRKAVREWEGEAEGLLLSFIGKLPGLAARLSLILACLDYAAGGDEPHEITASHFGRAAHLVEAYFLPMARRAYADASVSKADRAAMKLARLIRERGWQSFRKGDVSKLERSGLTDDKELSAALEVLVAGDCIRLVPQEHNPNGGRIKRLYTVNPALQKVEI